MVGLYPTSPFPVMSYKFKSLLGYKDNELTRMQQYATLSIWGYFYEYFLSISGSCNNLLIFLWYFNW